ncbi:MAG: hypothetical protein JWM02_3245 [Frankiales bacterium]|nr:hypothetical protein [Frankiales bacterium]
MTNLARMTRRLPTPLVLTTAICLVGVGIPLLTPAQAATAPLTFRRTVLQDQKAYGEPSLALSADGKHIAVCVPGGAGETSDWYSNDDGHTFGTSHTNSTNGGGDCELDYLPNGTLLNADLEITDSAIRYSQDYGKTWQGTQTAGVEQDRQWFAHSKDGKTAYLVYHDFAAEGEFYAQSNDGGLTWPTTLAAQPVNGPDQLALPGTGAGRPGDPASLVDQGGNTFSGPMLVSPDNKDLYVVYSVSDAQTNATSSTPPYGQTRGIVVAHKGPGASSFSNRYAVASDGLSTTGAIFPWGTIDKAGNVYVLFNSDKGSKGHFHTYYVVSTDKAKTWSGPVKVDDNPLAAGAQIYATGAAGAAGVLDIAWYGAAAGGGPADKASVWDIHFAQVRNATSAHPTITRALVAPGNPIHRGDICLNGLLCILGGDRSLADFMELAIGKDGMAQIAYSDNTGFTSGSKGRVVWAKQVGGQSALAPTASAASARVAASAAEPVTQPVTLPRTGGGTGGVLAATGLDQALPGAALLLLLGAAVVRRRRTGLSPAEGNLRRRQVVTRRRK